jgi:hypothetical protein
MNTKIIPIISLLIFFSTVFFSCEDTTLREYPGYAPVYMSYNDLRSAVGPIQNVDLRNPGKIYFKDNYIFIVEELKGIHVFDNINPASPVKKTFIRLPGVNDISISGSTMYADSYVDLVVLDVEDVNNIHEVGRMADILPYTVPVTANTKLPMAYIDKDRGVVIDWEQRTIKEKVNLNPPQYPVYWNYGGIYGGFYQDKLDAAGTSSGISGSGVGTGGSMARFGIKNNILYLVDQSTVKLFDISNKTVPSKINELYTSLNVETIFMTDNNMFLGTTSGMMVYDISNPAIPIPQALFTHAKSCDPVVVDDTLAYITQRTGTNCGWGLNVLDIVDIKNINLPSLFKSYHMVNPYGLGKDGDLLFICDGTAGLKVYDASYLSDMTDHLIFSYPDIKAYDVIPLGGVLILIGADGLYQYNYSDVRNIKLLSSITVMK